MQQGAKTGKLTVGWIVVMVFASLWITSAAHAPLADVPLGISVVYPEEGQQIPALDSTFIFGATMPGAKLTINGTEVPVYQTGGFLAYLPLDTGEFVFHLEVVDGEQSASLDRAIVVGQPGHFLRDTNLVILQSTLKPSNHLSLPPGEYLEVGFQGTPDCVGHFQIEGIEGTFPMAERQGEIRLSSGGYVFDQTGGAVFQPPGIYTGVWQVPLGINLDSARVLFCLSRDTTVFDSLFTADSAGTFCGYTDCVHAESGRYLSFRQGGVPQVVELTDSIQILRFGPGLGYLTTFQPAGIRAVATGESGGWTSLRLADGYTGWVETRKTLSLPAGTPIPRGLISYIRTTASDTWTDIRLDLQTPLPYKVTEYPEDRMLVLTVFGATTNTDWVRYDPADDLIERIDWNQDEPGVYQLRVHLTRGPIWGYEVTYDKSGMSFSIRKPPDLRRGLRGLTICVDPGHSLDRGAVGPTGLMEKNANLAIALQLQKRLESRGARVVMTRTADVQVDLYDRPAIARAADADIFVSIHNNALPDGINPFFNNGTSSYYYHPHSQRLARSVQPRLVDATKLSDFGLYQANLAVLRPTQYPSVLVECAFMMVPEQEDLLKREKFQKQIAKGIVRGLEDFVKDARHEQDSR